ncbi:MAG: histidine kinase [Candidatus Muproteobacteria bacterium RBG_16_62_13]|uniref:Histidine kinase n=1 Tax=Candidatus Muproteobacteria bacterium RBG_16_62_13 TaxID=1817756 RepID=A0A1F6T5F4_9PROT|nr:MAG: histidine kinase [Candidatus Muproteobacteria bacterium RBG_16_62_13]
MTACADQRKHVRAVYLLVDTSGTYATELDKAQHVINYLLGTLNPGDSFAVARVKSRSFSEKDIIAKVTFSKDPLQANQQKKQFKDKTLALKQQVKGGSAYTDITGGVLQAAEFLAETGAGRKTILIFSDMQEELDKQTVRNVPMNLTGIRVVAINVTKLHTDNIDPRRYQDRLAVWEKRARTAGASEWRVVNDLEHLERMFAN